MDPTLLLPRTLRPYAKAVAPAALGLVVALIHGLSTGIVRTTELEIALVAFLAASAAFAVDNGPEGWRAYLKALVPATLTVVGVLIHFLITGDFGRTELAAALTGLGSALVTLLVPNHPSIVSLAALYADEDLPDDDEELSTPPEGAAVGLGNSDDFDTETTTVLPLEGVHDDGDPATDDVLPPSVPDLALEPGDTTRPEGGVVPTPPVGEDEGARPR